MTPPNAPATAPPASPSAQPATAAQTNAPTNPLTTALILLLATGAGLSVASIYYNQPMLSQLAASFSATPAEIGWVPTLTQFGYALGILLLAPLADRHDRRQVILVKAGLLCVALALAGAAQSLVWLCLASAAIGMTASLAQDYVPAAAALAPEASRGKAVGQVMTGLLLGILLSRVISGAVAEHIGWRPMFFVTAVAIALLGWQSARRLPRFVATTQQPYGALLLSLGTLLARHPQLRRAALAQGFISIAFSAFWSTLALALQQPPFELGSTAAGAFGIAGAAGALIAPVAGGLADKHGPAVVTRIGAALVAASFAAMALGPQQVWLLVLGTVLFDLGVQATLIAHQSIIYALEPAARSRLNAVLIGAMFVSMALGALVAGHLLTAYGWRAVCGLGAVAGTLALAVRLWPQRAGR